ncbi:MAG: helix-turn-helix domain-containing protein [Acidimicrobiia bacterium]
MATMRIESKGPTAHTRQVLSQRQGETVATVLAAGLEQLRAHGYEQLSIRAVATAAGVTHTTAYAYFTSRAHLVAEIYWRELQSVPHASFREGLSLAARVNRAFKGPALLLADEPELAQAALSALLSTDPEVNRLRNAIGTDLASRVSDVVGPDTAPAITDALLLAFSGAMLQAGMGYFDFTGVVERMRALAKLLESPSNGGNRA